VVTHEIENVQNQFTPSPAEYETVIRPARGWVAINLSELYQYRELFFLLTWRDIKVRYKQTIIGAAWAVIQPFFTMVIFSLFFGRLAGIPSDGIPYPLFSYAALVPWHFFSAGVSQSANSLVGSSNLIKKIYFPRLIIPVSSVISGVIDFFLAFSVLLMMLVFYMVMPQANPLWIDPGVFPMFDWDTVQVALSLNVLWLPYFVILALVTALGVGLWLSAMNVQFRDVRYTVPFLMQAWLFITPIAYPSSLIENETLRAAYGINPMTGVVEGFRWALLGTDTEPGPILIVSSVFAVILCVSGLYYFRRMEKYFADVV
jgi:lipopolysaccharide transport system permease protein